MTRRSRWVIAIVAAIVGIGVAVGVAVTVLQEGAGSPSPAASESPDASPTSSPDLRLLAQERLDEHLEECTADVTGDAVSPGCGIRIPWGVEFARVDGIRFDIEQMPTLELQGDVFVADGGVLVATVTGAGQDGSPRSETYRTEDWLVRGDVRIEDGEVELSVW